MAVLTVHHWADFRKGLSELRRVARRRVVLTFDPLVHSRFWLLRDYLPAAAALENARAPRVEEVAERIRAARIEKVLIPHDCVDGFGPAYWRRPQLYVDPERRGCISMLAQLDVADLRPGLERLANDLRTGRWQERYGFSLMKDDLDAGFRLLVGEDQ